ncbi:hypothetical protein [Pseudonocardia adelaidensis]|uniref:YgiT-type zinc finger protein n=1 Tax=Pseudonocardia adelaidensis TaxID=648754 RepID=A0ABP9NNH6_9PSEU
MTGEGCPSCGGQWVDGRIAVPIVGSLRFTYRLGTTEVSTEVAARMCEDCGTVQLRARDPEAIVRAKRAAARGRVKPWPIRSPRREEG